MSTSSTLIHGALIFDGSGGTAFTGDVELDDGYITSVRRRDGAPTADDGSPDAGTVIDAGCLALCPGFIDMHAHADLALYEGHPRRSAITQGVTTEVIGQDGLSYVPAQGETQRRLVDQIAGWNGHPRHVESLPTDVASWLKALDGRDTNVAYLAPHGTIRAAVMGWEDRAAAPEELARMRELVAIGLQQGAVGLSAGLTYAPGAFAPTDELVSLCEVVAQYGGYFAPHHRSYGRDAIGAYRECIEIARTSGVALHLTHAHLSFEENAGRAQELIDLIDAAIADGVDITFDTYPYTAGSSYLHSVLSTARQQAGLPELARQLADPAELVAIGNELAAGTDGSHGLPVNWDRIVISSSTDPAVIGHSVAELAGTASPLTRFAGLLLGDDFTTMCIVHEGQEDNVRALMQHPRHTGGSDGLLVGARPHPRAFGTFARFLGHYSRDLGVVPLPTMIQHLTAAAADRLGLTDRGRIAPGQRGDLVLFDPDRIADTATYDQPHSPAVGIAKVWVGGELSYDNGVLTAARAGQVLTRRDQ